MTSVASRRPPKRRSRPERPAPDRPQGWRASKRTSKKAKKVRREYSRWRLGVKFDNVRERARRAVLVGGYFLGVGTAGILAIVLALVVLASAVNGVARWNARRLAAHEESPEGRAEKARDNLLVIGVQGNVAQGFLALRVEEDRGRVLGVAIPDSALIEVPGQGFERVGDSYRAGADVSMAAISNYLMMPFERYAIVDGEVYKSAVQNQSLKGVLDSAKETNLSSSERERLKRIMEGAGDADVALMPLPVRAITLGDETYFEPKRDEVADLLQRWWGVRLGSGQQSIRVVLYNGSGVPGVAGKAAQELIKRGFRVVKTDNADRFDYKETQIVVQHGPDADGERVRGVLGVGRVLRQEADQQIADIIVILGRDYAPASNGN